MMSRVITLTDQNYDELVHKSQGIFVIMFSADWCLPCQAMKPIFNNIAALHGSLIQFGIAERNDIPAIKETLNIKSFPRVYVYKNGQLAGEHIVSSKNYETEILKPLNPFLP